MTVLIAAELKAKLTFSLVSLGTGHEANLFYLVRSSVALPVEQTRAYDHAV